MTRPLSANELRTQGVFESSALQSKHQMKVKKSKGSHGHVDHGIVSNLELSEQLHPTGVASFFRSFVQNAVTFEEIMKNYELHKGLLESQHLEIERLNSSTDQLKSQIQRLEEEKIALNAKLKKMTEIMPNTRPT